MRIPFPSIYKDLLLFLYFTSHQPILKDQPFCSVRQFYRGVKGRPDEVRKSCGLGEGDPGVTTAEAFSFSLPFEAARVGVEDEREVIFLRKSFCCCVGEDVLLLLLLLLLGIVVFFSSI